MTCQKPKISVLVPSRPWEVFDCDEAVVENLGLIRGTDISLIKEGIIHGLKFGNRRLVAATEPFVFVKRHKY